MKVVTVFLAVLICVSLTNALDQPAMTAARNELNKAENALRKATADKGGHRARAINLIEQAIVEINRGIAYDRNTPGDRRRGRRNSDVGENDFAAAAVTSPDQPNMQKAKDHLQDALNHLQRASADKGGHREKAISLVRSTISEVNKGIAFDRSN